MGFHDNTLLMYQYFNAIKEDIINLKINFNSESSKKHVGNIERVIKLYK